MAKKSEYDYIFPSVLIRSKETSLLKRADMEKVMEGKCRYLAGIAGDEALADCYLQMAGRHAKHFEELYSNLK